MKAEIEKPSYLPDEYFHYMIERTKFHLAEAEKMWKNFDMGASKIYSKGIPVDVKFDIVCDVVCNYFGTNLEYVKKTKRSRLQDLVIVRHFLFYFLVEYLHPTVSKSKIADEFGFHRCSVLYSHGLIASYIHAGYRDIVSKVNYLRDSLDKKFSPSN